MDIRGSKNKSVTSATKCGSFGWVAANDGSVSAKIEGSIFLAKLAGMSESFITPEKFFRIDVGQCVGGGGRPVPEIKMHLRCYEKRNDVWSDIHAHGGGQHEQRGKDRIPCR